MATIDGVVGVRVPTICLFLFYGLYVGVVCGTEPVGGVFVVVVASTYVFTVTGCNRTCTMVMVYRVTYINATCVRIKVTM